jgi:hypothetical protein
MTITNVALRGWVHVKVLVDGEVVAETSTNPDDQSVNVVGTPGENLVVR